MIIDNSRYLFAENSANGDRSSNASITHNETHGPDKIAESIKENITSDNTPKEHRLLWVVDNSLRWLRVIETIGRWGHR